MRLVCPCCGAIASAEAWENDPKARATLDLIERMPSLLHGRILPYLALFRKADGGRGLSWTRASRLVSELLDLVGKGSIQWDGGEERPAPADLWARALDAVIARRPKSLENHNYLRSTAWQMAQGLAARIESDHEADRRSLNREQLRVIPGAKDNPPEEQMSSEEFRALAAQVGEAFNSGPKRNTCWTCGNFDPPRTCKIGVDAREGKGCDQHRRRRPN